MQRAAYQISKECACSSMGREHMWGAGTGLAHGSLVRVIVSHLHPAHRSAAGKAGTCSHLQCRDYTLTHSNSAGTTQHPLPAKKASERGGGFMTQPSWPPPTTTYTSSWGFLGGAGQSRMNREATTGRLPHPAKHQHR